MKKPIFLFLVMVLSSCDVQGILFLKNESAHPITMIINYSKSDLYPEVDSIVLEPMSNQSIMMGFGHTWTKKNLETFCTNVEKVTMFTSTDTIFVLEHSEDICPFFEEQRTGIFNQKLIIKYKNRVFE